MSEMHSSPAPSGSNRPTYDDEISLVDLVLTLWRRKGWVIGTFVVVVALALLYTLVKPGYFQQTAMVSLLEVPYDPDVAEPPSIDEAIVEPLRRYADSEGVRLGIERDREANRLRLRVSATDEQRLENQLVAVAAEARRLIERHWQPYARKVAEAEIAELQAHYAERSESLAERVLTQQLLLDELDERVAGMVERFERADTTDEFLALTEAEELLRTRRDREMERMEQMYKGLLDLEPSQLVDVFYDGRSLNFHIRDDRIQSVPVSYREAEASEQRRGLILALAVVLGGMLGLFAAFMAEFGATVRREVQVRRASGEL